MTESCFFLDCKYQW